MHSRLSGSLPLFSPLLGVWVKNLSNVTPRILKLVDDSIKPHLEKVKQCQEAITHKEIEINKQNKVIKSLQENLHSNTNNSIWNETGLCIIKQRAISLNIKHHSNQQNLVCNFIFSLCNMTKHKGYILFLMYVFTVRHYQYFCLVLFHLQYVYEGSLR
jgi:hypothetical protein